MFKNISYVRINYTCILSTKENNNDAQKQKDVMYTAYKNSMEDYHGMLWVQKILDVRKIIS